MRADPVWTSIEVWTLCVMTAERANSPQIAAILGRSVGAVSKKRQRFRLDMPEKPAPLPVGPPRPMLKDLAIAVCEQHGITIAELKTPSPSRRFAWPRQEFMWRAYQIGRSMPQIGAFLGRDHTTVLHGIRAHARRAQKLAAAPTRPVLSPVVGDRVAA